MFYSLKEMMGRSSQQGRMTRLKLRGRLNLLTSAQKGDLWRQSTWVHSRKVWAGPINSCYFAWSVSSSSKALPSLVPTHSPTTSASTAALTSSSLWTRSLPSTRCMWSPEDSLLAPSAPCSSSLTTKTSMRKSSNNIRLSHISVRLKMLKNYLNTCRHRNQWLNCLDIRLLLGSRMIWLSSTRTFTKRNSPLASQEISLKVTNYDFALS